MSTTTFKTATGSNRELTVKRSDGGSVQIRHYDAEHESSKSKTFFLNPTDAPALALATLETAGVTEHDEHETLLTNTHFAKAMYHLRCGIEEEERATAEANEQAKLEAEALELYNACKFPGEITRIAKNWDEIETGEDVRTMWANVARRAREMSGNVATSTVDPREMSAEK
ncbi:hypothetical protein [Glutamicibacter arilaitensis]|uniref:hypothetical protein n=1 Tax=Glutamicibacter arilaitensis TaxID=256701 RepID=UPI0038512E9B